MRAPWLASPFGMRILTKTIRWALSLFFASTIFAVVAIRFIPVYVTPLMVIRCFQNGNLTMHHRWIPLDEMSPHMPVAVMASEDSRFLLHHGFDLDAIGKAAKRNLSSSTTHKYGASTISQQTAKNVFLWPGRSWVRKGFEVYFTVLIELFLEQATHHGGLSQLYRDGRWHLRPVGMRAIQFWKIRPRPISRRLRAYCGHAAQSASFLV